MQLRESYRAQAALVAIVSAQAKVAIPSSKIPHVSEVVARQVTHEYHLGFSAYLARVSI